MEFRTTFEIESSENKISHRDPVMLIGSCFALNIGEKLSEGKIPVMVNPSGTVYNPVSVVVALDSIMKEKIYTIDDLYCHKGTWLSFDHYTDFSADEPGKVIDAVNHRVKEAHSFLASASFLFITFGTARIYRFRKSGKIVSNCHKVPASEFERELLTVEDIADLWSTRLDNLDRLFPGKQVVFSVSPVRHIKDGAHANQVSKSTLFLAVEKLLEHRTSPRYFPAYELLMDDLRDYRYYADDMLHPSDAAIEYIWNAFVSSYFGNDTKELWKEISAVSRGMGHRFRSDSAVQREQFVRKMLSKIDAIAARVPYLSFSREKDYFSSLIQQGSE